GGERRCKFSHGVDGRKVPWRYRSHDPARHTSLRDKTVSITAVNVAGDFVYGFRIETHDLCSGRRAAELLAHRLAHLGCVECVQLRGLRSNQIGEPVQGLLSLRGRRCTPAAVVESASCTTHGQIDIRVAAGGNL